MLSTGAWGEYPSILVCRFVNNGCSLASVAQYLTQLEGIHDIALPKARTVWFVRIPAIRCRRASA